MLHSRIILTAFAINRIIKVNGAIADLVKSAGIVV
jgi:predicted ATPase with chaperone activity